MTEIGPAGNRSLTTYVISTVSVNMILEGRVNEPGLAVRYTGLSRILRAQLSEPKWGLVQLLCRGKLGIRVQDPSFAIFTIVHL